MIKIDKLLAQLCPNGVDYKKIEEICDISRGRVMSKDFIKENKGNFPVYSSQTENDGELGKITSYDYEGEYLTWTTDGANAGSVFYRNGRFSITNVCGLLKVKSENVLTRYIYHTLQIEAPKYVNKGMGNPKLMSNVMARIKLAVPPLEVQREIVRVLDSFTLLTSELTSELTAELIARKKQYEYYRDTLLTRDSNIPIKKIEQLCKVSAGGDAPKDAMSKEKTDEYTIPIISNGVGENALYGYSNKAKITVPAVTVAARGTIGYAEYRDYPYFPIIRLLSLIPKDRDELDTKYLYYCLEGKQYNVPTTGIPQLTAPMVKQVEIPVPALSVQKKIVDVLDNFDKNCTELSIGLPAEIHARQKQYEYYRDKLLTFKEKE